MPDKTDTTILLDIYQRLGNIEQQLRGLTKDHDAISKEVDELRDFKSRFGAYIWVGGAIASGVFVILWQGIKYAADRWLH